MIEPDFINKIYEAAIIPQKWPDVLAQVVLDQSLSGGTMFTYNPKTKATNSISAGEVMIEAMRQFEEDGWSERNSRMARLAPLQYSGFVVDHDIFTDAELDVDPFYTEFLRPLGIGWGAGSIISAPTGDMIVFNFDGRYERGPLKREVVHYLDSLRPHFARASVLSMHLDESRSAATSNALESMGLQGCVLNAGGQVMAMNGSFARLAPIWLQDRRHRLVLNNRDADSLFVNAMSEIAETGGHAKVRSILMAKAQDSQKMVLHIIPILRDARDIFSQLAAIAIVTPVDRTLAPDVQLVQGLFDLTPAEARVAAHLAAGLGVSEIARKLGTSVHTTRNQLNRVLSKSGLRKQSELVSILSHIDLYRSR